MEGAKQDGGASAATVGPEEAPAERFPEKAIVAPSPTETAPIARVVRFLRLRDWGSIPDWVAVALAAAALFLALGELRQVSADQKRSTHYQAWQAITLAYGKPGNCGRIQALQDLNRAGVSLAGVDCGTGENPGAYLVRIDLPGANLTGANLNFANLSEAVLRGSTLEFASFIDANLRGADLGGTRLKGARFGSADMRGANLRAAISFTAEQLAGLDDWRGARLPAGFEALELLGVAREESLRVCRRRAERLGTKLTSR